MGTEWQGAQKGARLPVGPEFGETVEERVAMGRCAGAHLSFPPHFLVFGSLSRERSHARPLVEPFVNFWPRFPQESLNMDF